MLAWLLTLTLFDLVFLILKKRDAVWESPVIPGFLLLGVASICLSWLSATSFAKSPTLLGILWFGGEVLSAPLVLLLECWRTGIASFPTETLAIAMIAVVATPGHAVLPRRWTEAVTAFGLLAWFLCELIVAGAPA